MANNLRPTAHLFVAICESELERNDYQIIAYTLLYLLACRYIDVDDKTNTFNLTEKGEKALSVSGNFGLLEYELKFLKIIRHNRSATKFFSVARRLVIKDILCELDLLKISITSTKKYRYSISLPRLYLASTGEYRDIRESIKSDKDYFACLVDSYPGRYMAQINVLNDEIKSNLKQRWSYLRPNGWNNLFHLFKFVHSSKA